MTQSNMFFFFMVSLVFLLVASNYFYLQTWVGFFFLECSMTGVFTFSQNLSCLCLFCGYASHSPPPNIT